MSGESSKRSNLIDVTYHNLHSYLSGHLEGTTLEQLAEIIEPRFAQLRNLSQPFGKPSDASRKKVESGSVSLKDGVILHVENADKEFVFAISKRFDMDEVQALVLLRSFLYNEGLPSQVGSTSETSLVDELVEAITPFYHSERLYILRVLIPLFRASDDITDPTHEIATDVLPRLLPDAIEFANSLITEYLRKTKAELPESMSNNPKQASAWAKQNAKEQLVMLEVLFWTMWGFAPCNGALVVRIYETAYGTSLGTLQQNSTMLLDSEGTQILQDSSVMWILITIEVLELERAAEPGGINISGDQTDDLYWLSPESLKRIHELVLSHVHSQFACPYIAWSFVLSRLAQAASDVKDFPESYQSFFESLLVQMGRGYAKEREPVHELMARTCLQPDAGLFQLMLNILTASPLFVTAVAWRTGSALTDPNVVAYRSVFKGLVIAIMELVPVEMLPDFDTFLEVWIALFGRSESQSVSGICQQFWESDWRQGISRRAILDVARSRFPVQFRPLIRLLRALTATGFLDTDPLSTTDYVRDSEVMDETRIICSQYVFEYFNMLPSLSQVIPTSACTGGHALYEKLPERYGQSAVPAGLAYSNLRPLKLPGGSILPAKSVGRLLSGDGGDSIVVAWQHTHSGWKVLLELLTDYVKRRHLYSGTRGSGDASSVIRAGGPLALKLEDIGVQDYQDDSIITDALDLLRSVIQDNPTVAEQLLQSLEAGAPVVAHTAIDAQPPDLVQVTTMILEDALSRTAPQQKNPPPSALITSAISVLSALLALPNYSNRVWLYIRSTASLFGSEKNAGTSSAVLAAERLSGHYTTTLSLLHLVRTLFKEASISLLTEGRNERLLQVKQEVLLRAARFVHAEIWLEYTGWKYAQLGDRFEIGRRVSSFYLDVFQHSPPDIDDGPFVALSQALSTALLFKATTSTIAPLLSSVTTSGSILRNLFISRRFGDARSLLYLLASHLTLIWTLLNQKHMSPSASKPCLLEQVLCTKAGSNVTSFDGGAPKTDPVDALAAYVKDRSMGSNVQLEAMRVLTALCISLSSSQGSPPTIIGHLSDPEATVASLVRIIQHPYDDIMLRNAVWNFIIVAVDKEPALAKLFITGRFRVPSVKGKEKEKPVEEEDISDPLSALAVACQMLEHWRDLWETNPQLLASLLRFMDVVWQHGHEHKATLDEARKDAKIFEHLAGILAEELGPAPDFVMQSYVIVDGVEHSDMHEAVSIYAYRAVIKSHAAQVVAQDIRMHPQLKEDVAGRSKSASYLAIESILESEDQITELVSEAASNVYDPTLHDSLLTQVDGLPTFKLKDLAVQTPIAEREYGDEFSFSVILLRLRLHSVALIKGDAYAEELIQRVISINLNLTLTQVQTMLTESWRTLLLQCVPHLRGKPSVRSISLSLAASISGDLARENRPGDMMSNIHRVRLSLLLALLEIAWFHTKDTDEEIDHFMALVENVRGIIQSDAQPPSKSLLGQVTGAFHKPLLQIMYFCARHSRNLARRPKTFTSEHRLAVSSMLDAALSFVIDSLRSQMETAGTRLDLDIDEDLELLVAVFEQCTRPDVNSNATTWLIRCQETDVIRTSLKLFSRLDLVGFSDLVTLRARKQPLYAPHILTFHMALASIPSTAERLASEGILTAYSENTISSAISSGTIDVVLPELPGERSPAHRAYCSMLSIVAGVIMSLGQHGHMFDSEACGLVQLYGDQIHRALTWTIGDPLTLPLVEEIEQVVNLFSAIAQCAGAPSTNEAVQGVLRFFTSDALLLLQQLNYALTHPNHLASLVEPVTADEKAQIEADSSASSLSSVSDIDSMRRPFLARLVHRLFALSGSILSVLSIVSGAETVLTGEPEDWPLDQALIVPHSKVVLGEPASIGTLLELGNRSLDILRHLVDRPAAQALTPSSSTLKTLDVKDSVLVTRQCLEGVLMYLVTQLAMWLSKPEFDATSNDMDTDDKVPDVQLSESVKDRRRRQSVTLAERLRRGMTGEMASDLQSLIGKVKPMIPKMEAILGNKDVDLTEVLSHFVSERISSSS